MFWVLARDVRARTLRYRGWPSRLETKEGTEVGRKLVALDCQRKLRKQFIACCWHSQRKPPSGLSRLNASDSNRITVA